jgi:hypothetical protein
MSMTFPVIYAPALLVKKRMHPAISSSVPTLSSGISSLGKTPSPMIPAASSDGNTVHVSFEGARTTLKDGNPPRIIRYFSPRTFWHKTLEYHCWSTRNENLHPGARIFDRIPIGARFVASCFIICVVAALLCPYANPPGTFLLKPPMLLVEIT